MTPSPQIDENNNDDLRPSKEGPEASPSAEKSFLAKYKLSFWERWALDIIKCGPLPQHVAFIMDGNRRYARQRSMPPIEGHSQGYWALANVVAFCAYLEVREITVYAFSIENFKRSKIEVDLLMDLAYERLLSIWNEREGLLEHGIQCRLIGDMSLVPSQLQQLAARLELYTMKGATKRLNLGFAYTSRVEMTEGINELVSSGISPDLITERAFTQSWWSHDMWSPPDMLIRTGADDQCRLSDFLLWQTGYSVLYFTEVTWPEFNSWQMLRAVFNYQRNYDKVTKARLRHEMEISAESDRLSNEQRHLLDTFLEQMRQNKLNNLKRLAGYSDEIDRETVPNGITEEDTENTDDTRLA